MYSSSSLYADLHNIVGLNSLPEAVNTRLDKRETNIFNKLHIKSRKRRELKMIRIIKTTVDGQSSITSMS
jgi:hypothetical protein